MLEVYVAFPRGWSRGFPSEASAGGLRGGLEAVGSSFRYPQETGRRLLAEYRPALPNEPSQPYINDHDGWSGEANDMDTIYLASSDPSGPTLCMDVAGGAINDNGTPVQAWECNGDDGADLPNQQWTVDHDYQ